MTAEKDFIKKFDSAPSGPFSKNWEFTSVNKEYASKKGKKLQHVFHLNVTNEQAILANDEECAFFRSLMSD